ncbi:MAG: phosphoenolpyruvate synthase regulatory protein [Gammaproteobacteria bacterium CG11_big_fil_rev_8_21_14_0_20_46_22]|nr:MAG: phosphoenolpyruvate synthase regulatory protein [Gammaproteobacteria bacterium CG12_big_fil_rev_8_21_14_0_65_46_12]PIR12088.1 MAG: phosphoenolpyruvate synthase regulatory protein [Gammaproteobacteria bacterium CG11_big_fil_rev_8_21_14_0_20_46_22]
MYKIYCISDHTGLTSESFAKTLLSQFKDLRYRFETIPFVDSLKKAQTLSNKLAKESEEDKVIVFSSIVDPNLREVFLNKPFEYIDLFATFLKRLESHFGQTALRETGRVHGMKDINRYMHRIEAIDFAVQHDDGLKTEHYEKADVILTGVSRAGKTPTSLYLAIQYGIRAANYPLTEEDLQHEGLPACLSKHRKKLFGLMINPERLSEIRQERLPGSQYANIQQCRKELHKVAQYFEQDGVPYLDTTSLSIEEIATNIITAMQLEKRF